MIQDFAPKGSEETLREALRLLGPFKYATVRQAALHPSLNEFHDTYGFPSLEQARDWIETLAVRLNSARVAEKEAPRVADVVRELRDLKRAADQLAAVVNGLNDLTITALGAFGSRYLVADERRPPEVSQLARAAAVEELPTVWGVRLEALSRYSQACMKAFVDNWGTGDVDAPDAGGNSKPYQRLEGRPEWRLVTAAWALFDWCKPGQATGHVGGPFYRFVSSVYEYATGGDVKGIDSRVKRYASVRRKREKILMEMERVRTEIRALRATGREPRTEDWRRLIDLMEAEALLSEELMTGVPARPLGSAPRPSARTVAQKVRNAKQ